ncbi:MAG TPA: UMP kinase [Phycisphaerae bacterium]|nr:UMP kinase [Phycisphaerae bacterium]HUT60250.1 UMP kinase [Phycisphaerae bacterium]
MPAKPRYKRVVVKISGQSLCSPDGTGIDADALAATADEIAAAAKIGVQVGLVVGGGNLIRGRDVLDGGDVQRVTADHMGMLATVINALALRDALEKRRTRAAVMSAVHVGSVCEPFDCRQAVAHLEDRRVVIFAGGTGSPLFSTDMCAALRAGEVGAEILMKATKVDGVYDSDPVHNPKARRYERLTYQQVIADRLEVMDLPAVAFCMEHRVPIMVFQLATPGSLARALTGREVGTIVSES